MRSVSISDTRVVPPILNVEPPQGVKQIQRDTGGMTQVWEPTKEQYEGRDSHRNTLRLRSNAERCRIYFLKLLAAL